jgi:hypothetical protein
LAIAPTKILQILYDCHIDALYTDLNEKLGKSIAEIKIWRAIQNPK